MSWRWLACCVCFAACDRTFGIVPTHSLPADATATCPAVGTAPTFYDVVHQAIHQNCYGYAASTVTGEAMAACGAVFDQTDCLPLPIVAVGPAAGPLTTIALASPDPSDLMAYDPPVLAPEGDIAYVLLYNVSNGAQRLGTFTRNASGAWSWAGYRPIAILGRLGVPSSGPHRHMLVAGTGVVTELVEDDTGAWATAAAYSPGELGIATSPIYMSPDGLRIVYVATVSPRIATFYADRTSVDARFGAPVALDGVPWTTSLPFMTSDCSRVLFAALDNVLYVDAR